MRILTFAVTLLFASSAYSFSYVTGGCSNGCAEGEDWLYTNANEIDTALDAVESRATALEALDTVAEMQTAESINVILATEIDEKTEINDIVTADDIVFGTDIGVTVQALDSDLTDLADGSLSGSKIGTGLDITTATAGTLAIARMHADATLDADWDTAADINNATTDDDFVMVNGTHDLEITGSATFSGTLQGLVAVTTISGTSSSPGADSMRGAMFFCTNVLGCDVSLPAAVGGMNACFYSTTTGKIIIDPDVASSDEIRLDGALLGDGVVIDSASAAGDFVCLLASNANEWVTLGRSGTFVGSGAD